MIFLKSGQVFYQGRVDEIAPYFSSLGYECPENYNPCDYVMTLCQVDSVEELEQKGLFGMSHPPVVPPKRGMSGRRMPSIQRVESVQLKFEQQSSFLKQTWYLLHRELVNSYRDIPALIGRFGVTIVLNLLFGLIYWQIGSRDISEAENFDGHVGALAILSLFSLLATGQSVILAFPFERPLIIREYSSGTCK